MSADEIRGETVGAHGGGDVEWMQEMSDREPR
jgi:hypothetical protein